MAHPIIEALEQRYTVDPEVLRALEVMLRERDAAIQTQWSAQSVLLDVDSATLCLSDPITLHRPVSKGGLKAQGASSPQGEAARGEDLKNLPMRYEDLGALGGGGMGEVRRVRDRDLNCVMAMKSIRSNLLEYPDILTRFIEEAQLTAQLNHPGILPVHELGRHVDGRYYFTMQEVRGRTLKEVIASVHAISKGDIWGVTEDGWSLHKLIVAFQRVCEAVGYAHERGVIHRDIKPDNIMVGEHGEVIVLDWGLAKILGRADRAVEDGRLNPIQTLRSGDEGHETQMGVVTGTPTYMSPEQARGDLQLLDERTDVYALGVLLYNILSGLLPLNFVSQMPRLPRFLSIPLSVGNAAMPVDHTDWPILPPNVSLCVRLKKKLSGLATPINHLPHSAECSRSLSRSPPQRLFFSTLSNQII